MLVQHHPTLFDAASWPRFNAIIMLDYVALSLSLLKIFIQHRATLLAHLNSSWFTRPLHTK